MANPIKIPFILQNIGKAQGLAAGAATSVAGAAGSTGSRVQGAMFGAGGPGEITKGLGQIAKQLPGAGMMEGMTSAFKQGGPIGVITAGVAGMLGFVKSIMESSKVFQGIAGSFFKIFGAMADVFLLPFLPLAMRGMQELLKHMPRISDWGQKTADWIMKMFNFVNEEGIGGAIMHGLNMLKDWTLKTALPAAIDGVHAAAGWIWGMIKEVMQPIIDWFKDKFNIDEGEAQKRKDTGSWYEWDVAGGSTPGYDEPPRSMSNAEKAVYGAGNLLDTVNPFGSGVGDATEWGLGQWWELQGRHRDITRQEGTWTPAGRAAARGITPEAIEDAFIYGEGFDPTQGRATRQLGGSVPGGPGQGVNMTLHGGEEIIPRDVVGAMESAQRGVLGGFFGSLGEQIYQQTLEINEYVAEFKTKEGGMEGVIPRWDAQVLGKDLPALWTSTSDYLNGISSQTENLANSARGLSADLGYDDSYFMGMFNSIGEAFDSALGSFNIDFKFPEKFTPTQKLDEIAQCFEYLQLCINANLEYMPAAVQAAVDDIQNQMINISRKIEAGENVDLEIAKVINSMTDFGISVHDSIEVVTNELTDAAAKMRAISYDGMIDLGGVWMANAQFGAAANTAGVFLANRAEMAAAQPKPCTEAETNDPGNSRCFGGCQSWMENTPGHPCYIPPPEPDEPDISQVFVQPPPEPTPTPAPAQRAIEFEDLGHAGVWGMGASFATPEPTPVDPADFGGYGAGDIWAFNSGGIVPGRLGAPRLIQAHGGERIMPNSNPGGGTRAATSNRVMNVVVNARGGLAEILGELQRFEDMDEASFFNGVL